MTEDAKNSTNNITWHQPTVSRSERWKARGHGGAVLWFTGLSGSGKSSIANQVDSMLVLNNNDNDTTTTTSSIHSYVLDGDNVRHGLCADLGFSLEDRAENIRRVGEVAKLMADAGTVVLAAFISPYRVDRDRIRSSLEGVAPFCEIFVQASLGECESRDPKGLYQMAREGKIKNFTGIDDPYEEPLNAELILDSNSKSVDELAQEVVQWLQANDILKIKDS
ncbi:Adenylyl-sulfate kinase [Seminavis robusta]|uniref:Adenylyl-sulfate kinase n=1 Tax=Seminavis robusta TaxID=568900 RepID=A0A9N8DWK5_9STRA|nr:Adenylyl-sulfate kinase [Seminavis robusta]|eukprot:Sro419_g139100.1 Adenylyl-sulfate kinase (222) ;mRNA; r:36772-37437